MSIKVIIICGSESDFPWAEQIKQPLDDSGIATELHAASAHKKPLRVLEILTENKGKKVIFVTIAGRSNALSGFVGADAAGGGGAGGTILMDVHGSISSINCSVNGGNGGNQILVKGVFFAGSIDEAEGTKGTDITSSDIPVAST